MTEASVRFSPEFRADLDRLFRWRRDVRRFRSQPVPETLLADCLRTFELAPSVGLSEPWRILRVESDRGRSACLENFRETNARALESQDGSRAKLYARLKLSGMVEAPVQLAVFCDESTVKGAGLGVASMPETRAYSAVGAIMLFWLSLRSVGLGLGWVSILDPVRLARDLSVQKDWRFIGYLCVGWPEEEDIVPELEREGWETRAGALWVETR